MESFNWQKKDSGSKSNKGNEEFKNSLIAFLLISCVLLFAALIYVLVSDANSMQASNQKNPAISTLDSDTLLATVNQEAIYASDVIAIFNTYPQESRTEEGLKQALIQTLNNKLLLQEAKRIGLGASNEEVDQAINAFMTSNSLTQETLENNLKNSNFTISQFRASIEEGVILQKMINKITDDVLTPSESEIEDFYLQNEKNLTMLGRSTTRQIFLFANTSNADDKLTQIKDIASKLNATNFCDIVVQYSEDETTKNNCGLYESTQGQLLSEYEQAVFESKPGDVKLVSTRIGYHIILVENVTQPRLATFEEAKPQLNQYLLFSKKQAQLVSFINQLREKAQIIDYTAQNEQ